ncbi:TetR/AcrR family transcriptional regulator [Streptomyces sp. AgN23]|uniref:TetR/AcrR family transcriptional regulator n=1 Tax=Streptomyces sp. AgN23 TaxID=1188315 RepID=UPI001B33B4A2|nr:TetR/AcrR family transcriptional regulator [Streptomyces sp. AgN23]QTI87245.1 TetR/AcrR family transcriptional regulator [Streptomyces sp. AgN23]
MTSAASSGPLPSAPQQDRSRRSARQILTSAITLLTDNGIGDFTMTDVSRGAGLSIGGVYGRYPTKEALLREVKDHVLSTLEAAVAETVETTHGGDLRQAMTALVTVIARSLHQQSRLFAFVFLHSGDDPQMRRRGFQFHDRMKSAFMEALLPLTPGPHSSARKAVDILYETIIHSLISRSVTAGSVDPGETTYASPPDWETYARALTTMCCLYLTAPPHPSWNLGDSDVV